MIDKIKSLLDIFDVGDFKFFLMVAKKNFKNLISITLLISLITLLFSLNQEKKYLSSATIVVAPDEQNLVNIEEVYSLESLNNRINNQMAILKSDEVYEYILADKKNITQFKNLYAQDTQNFFQRILNKKQDVDKAFLKSILSRNFTVNNLPRSDVLELSFVSKNPKISQLALNSIIESYQRYEIDSKIKITNYSNGYCTKKTI
jgi:uncharacterized protein involved in exopolysaccharide biosynthesis